MRPTSKLLFFLLLLLAANGLLVVHQRLEQRKFRNVLDNYRNLVAELQLTDLCITTEARYTRNPAVSDPVVPFMDHPGAIEHFPSGTFFRPPQNQ